MRVAKNDGVCRHCGGPLSIFKADDEVMGVDCRLCGIAYYVNVEAFRANGRNYHAEMIEFQRKAEEKSHKQDRRKRRDSEPYDM